MSEQQSEATSGETGSVGPKPAAPDMSAAKEPVTAAQIDSPMLAPDQEETSPKPDAPKVEAIKAEAPKVEVASAEAKVEPPRIPGKLLIMSPGERAWSGDEADAKPEAAPSEASSGKRRISAMAAVVALATVAGALGGALATAGLGQLMSGNSAVAAANNSALEASRLETSKLETSKLETSMARIDAEILALKASVEHTSKAGVSQFNKTSDRLDKVEKAQGEPAAKLAKLSEAVEKLRAQTAPAAVTPAAARDVTGTVSPPATAAAVPLPAPKPEIARLPTVEGWVLRDVENGSALIEGRQGVYEVYAGDPVPGLGRIDAIRKQDGKWVVVTSKGLIVAR